MSVEKLSPFGEHWSPKIVGELNGQHVKLVKLLGEFVWHHDEDELFFVMKGRFRMEFRDRSVGIEAGEFIVVLFEPASTLNTGNVSGELMVSELERI